MAILPPRRGGSDLRSAAVLSRPTGRHPRCPSADLPNRRRVEGAAIMKIRRIAAYRVDLPLHEGSYKWSGGKSVAVFDSTIVEIETDDGTIGHGEVCPLGSAYLPSYAAGVRAGIAELAPRLIGEDPTQSGKLNRVMDAAMKGH